MTSITTSLIALTDWGRDKMAAIFHTTFSNPFYWMKIYEFPLQFHWGFCLIVQLTLFQHWFRLMAWCRPGDKPLSEPMMIRLLTHICVSRPQCVKKSTWRPFCFRWPCVHCVINCIYFQINYDILLWFHTATKCIRVWHMIFPSWHKLRNSLRNPICQFMWGLIEYLFS